VCAVAGKYVRTRGGLKIHRGKMGCAPILNLIQHAGQPCDHSLHAPDEDEVSSRDDALQQEDGTRRGDSETRLRKIKWPTRTNKTAWGQFDDDVDVILNTTLAGGMDRKMDAMTTIMYIVGMDRFGSEIVRAG